MSIAEMCALAELSRAGYYRFLTTPAAGDQDIDLRDAIQRIALEFPSYGRPRMTEELHRRGWQVGPNRVYRIMREDNLLCLRRRKFVVTTNSNHDRPIYPNLARNMVLTGIDQLWVAEHPPSHAPRRRSRRLRCFSGRGPPPTRIQPTSISHIDTPIALQ